MKAVTAAVAATMAVGAAAMMFSSVIFLGAPVTGAQSISTAASSPDAGGPASVGMSDLDPQGGIRTMSLTPVEPGAPYSAAGFPFGQCTWWAALNVPVSWSGNAWQWWSNSPASRHSLTPSSGDIVVYGPEFPGSDGDGHVAVVLSVQSPKEFEVSEMNFLGMGIVDERTSDSSYVLGFIEP